MSRIGHTSVGRGHQWMTSGWRSTWTVAQGLAKQELSLLLTLLVLTGGLLAFVALASEVLEGETDAFDRAVLLGFRAAGNPADPLGPPWLEEMARDFTALGSTGVLTLIFVVVVGYLVIVGKRGAALLVFASVAGGQLLSTCLKLWFERPRPDLVIDAPRVFTAGFPSGHAMLSAVTFLTVGALLMHMEAAPRARVFVFAVSVVLTLLVGVSRVYLGVHWPTDVLAGWCVGPPGRRSAGLSPFGCKVGDKSSLTAIL